MTNVFRFSTFSVSALAGAVMLASGSAMAAGLTLNEQSASSAGMAYAGRGSSALDASTVFGNPAGMSKLDGTHMTLGTAFIDASVDIKNASSVAAYPDPADPLNNPPILVPRTGSSKGDMTPGTAVPFAYYTDQINDRWHVGFGVFASLGGKADYERNFIGRYKGDKTEVQVITFQPTLSYRIADNLSVGGGVTVNRIEGELNTQLHFAPNMPDGHFNTKGSDTALGYNLGVLWDVVDGTSVGLTYRSKVKYKLHGTANVNAIDAATGAPVVGSFRGGLDFTQPEAVEASLSQAITNELTLHAGAVWTRWSELQEIRIETSGVPASLASRGEPTEWRDQWAFALGGSYQLTPTVVLRAGFALDESPATNEHRSVRVPYGNRKVGTLGVGWQATQNLGFDFAYGYLKESDAAVNQAPDVGRPGFSATYKNSANIFAAQLNYKF
ncbi:OmpP1/FadL family transporter [Isoalcanivorax beigongshangi]|uniref:OmpP1/FadL family transporter n=1 Tax=Isoalcanivorax beigongshangi TaxID=3238810 RepID=A0ABV4AE20_9GAMM